MDEMLNDCGLIFFSTLLQPPDIDRQGLNWWYAAPRNAHISLHTKLSLHKIGERFGFSLGSFTESYHIFFREIPAFARHFFKPEQAQVSDPNDGMILPQRSDHLSKEETKANAQNRARPRPHRSSPRSIARVVRLLLDHAIAGSWLRAFP